MRAIRIVMIGGALSLFSGSGQAQTRATTADLTGVISDVSGAVVRGARVVVTDPATNLQRVTESREDGRFVLQALAPAQYEIRISLAGFATQLFEHVDLPLGSTVELPVTLMIATQNEQIVVRAEPPLIDVRRTAIASIVSDDHLHHLPLNGRNFISLSLITPGVSVDRVPQQGAGAGSGLTVVGQRARSNNITVDGLDNNDTTAGSVRATFSQDAIQEFQVVAHSYEAEFGKATGGVINIVTKSGTNVTTGSGFLYFRDEVLNAKEHFERFNPDRTPLDVPKAPFGQKQFGAVLGGPISRDRTFYFGSYERLSTQANNFVTIDDTRPIEVFGRPVGTVAGLLRSAGFPVETGHVPYQIRSDAVLGKIDHRFDSGRTLTFRYNFADSHNGNIDPFGGIVARSRGGAIDSTDHMFVGGYTTVSSSFVNELRAQIAGRSQGVYPLDPICNGVCDRDDEGGPTVEIAGAANAGRNRIYPQLRESMRYQVVDTLTALRGSHEFKGGFDAIWVRSPRSTLPLHYGGRYIFVPLPSVPGLLPAPVTAIQAFALGLPGAYVQGYGNPGTEYGNGDASLFIQDTWRLRPNLTAKLGLRYQTQFWSDFAFDVPGFGPFDFPSDRNDIGPRVGVSWSPWRPNVSLHAAYGMFFDRQISAIAGITDVIDGTTAGTRTLVLRFPQTVAAWQTPGRRISEPTSAYPSLVIAVDPAMKTPYAHHASLGADWFLSRGVRFSADGIFVRGFNQLGALDYNPVMPALGANRRPLDAGGVAGTSASVVQYTSFGETWYRALMFSLDSRSNQRRQVMASYTWSLAQDTSSDFQTSVFPQNNGRGRNPDNPRGLPLDFDPRTEKGHALHDQRHRLVVSGTLAVPAGVYLSTILTAASGWPYNILAGADLNGDGDGGAFPPDRARRVPSDPMSSVPRNSGRLPAQITVDIRASRPIALMGNYELEVIIDVFNALNRSNFAELNNIFGTGAFPESPLPTYGQFQRSGPPRQIQLGARLRF